MNKHKLLEKLIQWSVPTLNIFRRPQPWPYSLYELSILDPGTLGKELHSFLKNRELGYLPKYEVHDAYHALLGYGTTVTEELRLQAFMWGNGNSTFAGKVLYILGSVVFPSKYNLLKAERTRGAKATPLKYHSISKMIPQRLSDLRKHLCIS